MKQAKSISSYDFKEIEKKWSNSFSLPININSKEKFSIVLPPPNVTGNLHLGHALNSTIQDVLIKYHYLNGTRVRWTPGTDHAGIATQMLVEKSLAAEGIDSKNIDKSELIAKIWKWKDENGNKIIHQLKKLGLSCEWDKAKFTLDKDMSFAVNEVFISLFNEGLIYKEKTLVNWDPSLKSAISDLEVVSENKKGFLYSFKYFLLDSDDFITVSTTRPETAFGDTAIAVNPNDSRYKKFIGKKVKNIFNNKNIPIISDTYADMEKGSGAVKITPGHDFNDFEIGKKHNLEMINILNDDGTLNENTGKSYQNLTIDLARVKILKFMKDNEIFVSEEEVLNTIPKGDRTSSVIEPLLKDQWFLDVKQMAIESINAVESGHISFKPKFWENTFFEWMKNIKPWCISRQILWGHQLPVWTCEDNNSIAAHDAKDALKLYKKKFGYVPESLIRENDVLDTWFSSGLWPFSTLGWPESTNDLKDFFPTSILVTGFDIIFFWVARMIMMSLKITGKIPFKTIYIHNLIRDSKGNKMSKTKGNVIDPLDLIQKYGTDSLRFYLSSNISPHSDLKISDNQIETSRNFMNKIWNAYSFIAINSDEHVNENDVKPITSCEHWITFNFIQLLDDYKKNIEECEIEKSALDLYRFFWDKFCDWYIEVSKITIQKNHQVSSTVNLLQNIFKDFLILLFPYCPFLSKELMHKLTGTGDILSLPNIDKYSYDIDLCNDFIKIKKIITSIRSLRKNLSIPPKEKITIYVSQEFKDFLDGNHNVVSNLANVDSIESDDNCNFDLITNVSESIKVSIKKDNDLNYDVQINKLKKDLVVLQKDLQRSESKLKNSKFLSSAPEDIVLREKRILEESTEYIKNLNNILKQLD